MVLPVVANIQNGTLVPVPIPVPEPPAPIIHRRLEMHSPERVLQNMPVPVPVSPDHLMQNLPVPVLANDQNVLVVQVPVQADVNRVYGQVESTVDGGVAEAFADDVTAMGKLTRPAITSVKHSLDEFAGLSGLKCNVDKSMIMITGTGGNIPDYILNSGFQITDKLHILGMDITRDTNKLSDNFDAVIEKIRSTGNFWAKFKLSLMGRINIAKSLMLSNLSYLGSILTPTPVQLEIIEDVIYGFISSNMRISRKYIMTSVKKGGIGMVNIEEFLTGIKCNWIKKSYNSNIDVWRRDINSLATGNVLNISPLVVDHNVNPIIANIVNSFDRFKVSFNCVNDNFLESNVLGNPNLYSDRRTMRLFNVGQNLGVNFNNNVLQIKDLLSDRGTVRPLEEIQATTGTQINQVQYDQLKTAVLDSLNIVRRNRVTTNQKSLPLDKFITGFKKGSKPFRKVLAFNREKKLTCGKKTQVKTFFRLTGITLIPEPELEQLSSLWSLNCLPNKLREFIYKFNNNVLGLNTRVSHFNNAIARGCTFCSKNAIIPVPDEDFIHLFFTCRTTNQILENFCNIVISDLQLNNDQMKKKFFFVGINPLTNKLDNLFLQVLSKVIMYSIWECKLSKQIPSLMKIQNDCFFIIENIRISSSVIREHMSINLQLCREWNAEVSRRR
jgi:hypothetical protein